MSSGHVLVYAFLISLVAVSARAQVSESPLRRAGPDMRLGLGARSMPLGGAAFGELGFGAPIWGDWRNRDSFTYGYVRPRVLGASSITVNSFDVAFSLHPVSFLSFTLGRGWNSRLSDRSSIVDCEKIECGGSLRSDYGAVDLALAWKQFFLIGTLEGRDIRPANDREDFYEDSNSIVGRKGYDRVFTHGATLGWRPPQSAKNPEGFFIGINERRSEAHLSGTFSERLTLVAGYSKDDFRFSYSAGVYRSSLQGMTFTGGVLLEWRPLTGLAPF